NRSKSGAVVTSVRHPLCRRCSSEVPHPPGRTVRTLHCQTPDEGPSPIDRVFSCLGINLRGFRLRPVAHSLILIRQVSKIFITTDGGSKCGLADRVARRS